jgi:hypothetical protein
MSELVGATPLAILMGSVCYEVSIICERLLAYRGGCTECAERRECITKAAMMDECSETSATGLKAYKFRLASCTIYLDLNSLWVLCLGITAGNMETEVSTVGSTRERLALMGKVVSATAYEHCNDRVAVDEHPRYLIFL